MKKKTKIEAVDLFCGIGGLSYGLLNTGIEVKAGIDIDKSCKYPFETNCKAPFIAEDIKDITGSNLDEFFNKDSVKVLVGCAPCQPFSSYTYKKDKTKDGNFYMNLLD